MYSKQFFFLFVNKLNLFSFSFFNLYSSSSPSLPFFVPYNISPMCVMFTFLPLVHDGFGFTSVICILFKQEFKKKIYFQIDRGKQMKWYIKNYFLWFDASQDYYYNFHSNPFIHSMWFVKTFSFNLLQPHFIVFYVHNLCVDSRTLFNVTVQTNLFLS